MYRPGRVIGQVFNDKLIFLSLLKMFLGVISNSSYHVLFIVNFMNCQFIFICVAVKNNQLFLRNTLNTFEFTVFRFQFVIFKYKDK